MSPKYFAQTTPISSSVVLGSPSATVINGFKVQRFEEVPEDNPGNSGENGGIIGYYYYGLSGKTKKTSQIFYGLISHLSFLVQVEQSVVHHLGATRVEAAFHRRHVVLLSPRLLVVDDFWYDLIELLLCDNWLGRGSAGLCKTILQQFTDSRLPWRFLQSD